MSHHDVDDHVHDDQTCRCQSDSESHQNTSDVAVESFRYKSYLRQTDHEQPHLPKSTLYRWLSQSVSTDSQQPCNNAGSSIVNVIDHDESTQHNSPEVLASSHNLAEGGQNAVDSQAAKLGNTSLCHGCDEEFSDRATLETVDDWMKESHDDMKNEPREPAKRICVRQDAEKSFNIVVSDGPADQALNLAVEEQIPHDWNDAATDNSTVIAGHEVGGADAADETMLRMQRLQRFMTDLDVADDLNEEQFRQQLYYYEQDEDEELVNDAASYVSSNEDEIILQNEEEHPPDDNGDGHNGEEEDLDSPLYDGADISKGQTHLLLLSYIFKHDISDQQLEDFCRIMDILFPGILAKSAYRFKKGIPEIRGSCRYYVYCFQCGNLIGPSEVLIDDGVCAVCNFAYNKKESLSKGRYFIVFPMKEQIQAVLEGCTVSKMKKPGDFIGSEQCFDLISGECLKSLRTQDKIHDNDITALWNFDGVPVFNSTDFSIWPLQFTINELSYHERKKNVLMYGLWFGGKKPRCDIFLQPLKEEAQKLGDEGFNWRNPVNGEIVNSRFFFTTATCDAVARPLIRNCTQFNGRFGCDWCLHPGERIARGNGHTNSYPFLFPEPEQRTHEDFVDSGLRADLALLDEVQQPPVDGVKGSSYLSLLPHFNIVKGFVVDYMHTVLLGVTRQFTTLWFDSCYHESPWYIGTYSDTVDELLLTVKPPSEITRCPRSLSQRKLWKASEWRTFLLYTGPVVLKDILEARYYDHFLLLSTSVYVLLKEGIPLDQINEVELALNKFCLLVADLYGQEHASFNVHQLTHMCDSVRNWGPLFATSAFPFESNNHVFMRMFNGKRYPAQQIARKFTLKKGIEAIARVRMGNANDKVRRQFEMLMHTGRYLPKKEVKVGSLYLYGKPVKMNLCHIALLAVQNLLGGDVPEQPCTHHLRFSNGTFCCYSCDYGRGEKHQDDVVLIEGERYCRVKSVVLVKVRCECDEHCNCEVTPIVILEKYRISRAFLFQDRQLGITSSHIVQLRDTYDTIAVHPRSLKAKCFVVTRNGMSFAIAIPNNFETD